MNFDKENLLKTFESIPEIIQSYINNIPKDLFDRKRSPDSWTIREHLYHIVSVQEMLYQRIIKIRDEDSPVITPYFPENEENRESVYESVEAAFLKYTAMRKKQIELINELTESDFAKEAVHKEYIRYNIPIIINHMIFHEYWHMYRIEELWITRDEYFS